ncbi:MarR family winged helix-turn-helix transcriptional regulator [Roseimaritima ulvae]|uniref:HTH-type transcriptional regulator MhqR n=1 Tax=Roseimaritima ulvae TaxID=980254 RepID=A0A5B9R3Q2_9BACT|nr:MarR family transcriptional regulator [Roseimaritima ulvae]QEG40981.1 HTH-type transcriptional regulator MhqR [Roseimaritima ulvae]
MKLQDELKRPVPFATSEQETLLNLLRVGDRLENHLARFFRERGLTVSRFNVLRNLLLADQPLTCGEIGERMIQIVPAITSLVDHLEKQGLVERKRCQQDRRVVHVRITRKGRKLADDTMAPLAELEQQLLKKLTKTDQKNLIALLEKTRGSIAAACEASLPADKS